MKNNTAILNCVTKLITFKYLGEIFTVDIKEGDLSDSWNTITDKNGVMWDFNFSWEDDKACKPSLWLYALKKDDCDNLTTDTSNYTIIKIGKSSADVFFKDERFRYKFDVSSPIVAKLYNDKSEMVFTTKSFNKACDEVYLRKKDDKSIYMVIMDKNNATKRID